MLKKLERYVKKDDQAFLKIAALMGYSDTAPVRNWIRRKSIPKHMQSKLKQFLEGEINVTISIK
tara:strand:+ start:631 stop:822 length:192 start_codon:yes stop_codon:yes gene_type:complete